MAWDDFYRKTFGSSSSSSLGIRDKTIEFVRSEFANSPFFKTIKLNGEDIGVRINTGKTSDDKKILFMPETEVVVGDLLTIDNEYWMSFSVFGNDVFPKAVIQRCNDIIKWKKPSGQILSFPCRVTNSKYISYDIVNDKFDMKMLEGGVFLYVRYNDDIVSIKPEQRFIFGSQVYKNIGMDDLTTVDIDDNGIAVFTMTLTTAKDGDDFVNKIADNSHLNAPNNGDDGGVLW